MVGRAGALGTLLITKPYNNAHANTFIAKTANAIRLTSAIIRLRRASTNATKPAAKIPITAAVTYAYCSFTRSLWVAFQVISKARNDFISTII